MELGIFTFADLVTNPKSKTAVSGQKRLRQMIEMEQLGSGIL
jgi:hypothetical protein